MNSADCADVRSKVKGNTSSAISLSSIEKGDDGDGSDADVVHKIDSIPQEKAIRVLYHDESIIVIDKPSKLRSVPGHAKSKPKCSTRENDNNQHERGSSDKSEAIWKNTPQLLGAPPIGNKKRKYHETWAYALQDAAANGGNEEARSVSVNGLIKALAALPNSSAVPRKRRTFIRYCVRTNTRLIDFEKLPKQQNESFPGGKEAISDSKEDRRRIVETIAEKAFTKIFETQRPMLDLPTPTPDSESALGQLRLLGFESCPEIPIKVVHRLDMETSGVMVFARTDLAASKLCEAWRKRDVVAKEYLAQINRWPPYHDQGMTKGSIDFPLSPSDERLKWKIDKNGKSSLTLWEALQSDETEDKYVVPLTLRLQPITGRTHQLRIPNTKQ